MSRARVKEKNRSQMDYIFRRLKDLSVCEVTDKYTQELEKVSVPLVKEILQNRFTNGPDMKAVLCLFDTMILSSKVKKEHGLYHLSTTIQKWVKKMDKINVKSSEAKVYVSDILSGDIQVIIKSPKNAREYEDLIREYYIGVTKINGLRYYVPNFMYTLGAFLYPKGKKTSAFVIYEKIPGENLEDLIKTEKINFDQFLALFFQILIALELAQRNIRFCHFDLHASNVIIRPISHPFSYTVVLDNKRYDITAHEYIPILVDFGMSSVTDDERIVGSYYHSRYGMMNYLIQGVDMYKLLFYSSLYSVNTRTLHRQILDLFVFYGRNDPYEILIQQPGFLKKVSFEFAKQASFTKVATNTPLEFAEWILQKPEYRENMSRYVNVTDRDVFFPINYSSTVQQYSDIFRHSDEGRQKALNLALDCTNSANPSYVLMEYTQGLLQMYDNQLHSDELKQRLTTVTRTMKRKRRELLRADKKMLFGYAEMKIPDRLKLHDYINRILNTKIGYKKNVKGLINRFMKYIVFYKQLSPYLQFLYTVRELHLDERYKTYRTFVSSFTGSEQYLFYQEFHSLIERTIRWSITLLESSEG
jgi:serine/threonine protein kinase